MKTFLETPFMAALVATRQNAQDRLLLEFMRILGGYLSGVGDAYLERAFATRQQPALELPALTDLLYKYILDNVAQAYRIESRNHAHNYVHTPPIKRLARRIPAGNVPTNMRDLDALFTDQRAMQRIFRRSQVLSRGLRSAYLKRLRDRFREIMPAILENRISPGEARAHIQQAWGATASRAQTIFRTESTKYFAQTQLAYYKDAPRIIGFLFHSIRDAARTEICRCRHGLVYRPGTLLLCQNTPALHYNCRSELIPMADTPANRKMLEDPARDPTKVPVVPPQFKK